MLAPLLSSCETVPSRLLSALSTEVCPGFLALGRPRFRISGLLDCGAYTHFCLLARPPIAAQQQSWQALRTPTRSYARIRKGFSLSLKMALTARYVFLACAAATQTGNLC